MTIFEKQEVLLPVLTNVCVEGTQVCHPKVMVLGITDFSCLFRKQKSQKLQPFTCLKAFRWKHLHHNANWMWQTGRSPAQPVC